MSSGLLQRSLTPLDVASLFGHHALVKLLEGEHTPHLTTAGCTSEWIMDPVSWFAGIASHLRCSSIADKMQHASPFLNRAACNEEKR